MSNRQTRTDVILIGAGIMSATLGILLKELVPDWDITVFEKLANAGEESSNEWNNAGTGHAALCELNYTVEKPDGFIDISKAININEQFQVSMQFWSYLVNSKLIYNPQDFIMPLPHMSFVQGEQNVEFLKKRFEALSNNTLFQGMEYSEDPEKLMEWIPLIMQDRPSNEPIAATKIDSGTDVNFGALTRMLFDHLESKNVEINYRQSVDGGAKFAGIRELSKTRSIDGESARFPQIVTAGNNVYVAWQDRVNGGNEIFLRASADLGSKFTGIKNLSRNNTGDSISPSIAAITNNVFVGWSDTSPGKSEILLRSSIDSGNTFRGIKNVSWSIGNSYDPQLAVSRSNLYALWEDDSQEGLTFDLTFRGSSDGGQSFSDKQNLARYIGESSDYGQLTTTENNVYVVWSESPQYIYPAKYEVFIKASRNNGTNFGDGVNLSNSEGNSIDPAIAVSEDQRNVFVVWSDSSTENSEISLVRLRI
jgi:hypothetical protein